MKTIKYIIHNIFMKITCRHRNNRLTFLKSPVSELLIVECIDCGKMTPYYLSKDWNS